MIIKYNSDYLPQFNSKKETKQQTEKPRTIKPYFDGIPSDLKTLNQWVCWRWTLKEGEWNKVPIDTRTFANASSTNPETWSSFEAVCLAYQEPANNLDGIGFVFKEGSNLTGIDFDECRYIDGSEDKEVKAWIDSFQSYTELSPTCGGYHTLCYVSPELLPKFQSKHGRYEAYNKGRFFCITGHANGLPIHKTDEPFTKFAKVCLGERVEKASEKASNPPNSAQERTSTHQAIDGAEMRYRLHTALQDTKFKRLYQGKWQEIDTDQSDAVYSFLLKVAFYFDDSFHTVDTLFRQSSLWCDKWSEGKWERLGENQWDKAINQCEERYTLPTDWQVRLASIEGLPIKTSIEELAPGLPQDGLPVVENTQGWTALELWNYKSKTRSLIPKVLMSGSHTLLSAREKRGKTYWTNNFIADWLSEGVAFNHSVNPMPILYLDYEMGIDLFREAYFPQLYPATDDGRFLNLEKHFRYFSRDGARLPDYLTVDWLKQIIKGWDTVGMIVVDSVRGAFGSSPVVKGVRSWENDSDPVGKLLRPLTDFCHSTQWNIISIHHHNKNDGFSGSTEFGASVDAIWDFIKDGDGDDRTLKVIGRGVSGRFNFSFQDGRYTLGEQVDTSDTAIQNWVIEQHKNGPLTQKQLLDKRGLLPDNKIREKHNELRMRRILVGKGYNKPLELAPNYQLLLHAG